MEASNVSGLLYKQLGYRGDKQKVISGNIANINTPGYKAKELVFENELQKASDASKSRLDLATTHPSHIKHHKSESVSQSNQPRLVEKKGLQEQNDGNNVNLDQEMSEMAKNNVMFNAIQSSIKKDANWFRSVIESSSKN